VDETDVKVKKVWMYLSRAVDSQGNTLEFLLKRRVKPGLGFFSMESAWRTLQGYKVRNMIRKGQVQGME
jgi:transposase-like protein